MPEQGETVAALAATAGGRAEGVTSRMMRGVAALEEAGEHDVVFADSDRTLEQALAGPAGCIVAGENADARGRTVIRARNPKLAFARIVTRFHPPPRPTWGIHPTATVDYRAHVGDGVHIGPSTVVGAHVDLGAGAVIGPGCYIGDNCRIGENCLLHPRVTLYANVTLGARVILHSGVVIGSDGFGYVFDGGGYEKFPQVGRVEIGDDVEIGANSTVDRAALGVTRIGRGTKIDNLVQIGHNVSVGENCAIAALTGISGSAVIEDYVVMAGQVGLGDHCQVQRGAVLGGQCGVLPHKVIRPGQTVWGTPARPIKEYLAQLAALARLAKRRKQ